MHKDTKTKLQLVGALSLLVVLAIALVAGADMYTARREKAEREERREKFTKLAAEQRATLMAQKEKAIADALALRATDPAAGIKSLAVYERFKLPEISAAVEQLNDELRLKKIAMAREYLKAGEPGRAADELLAYQGANAPADISKLMSEISVAALKRQKETERAEIAARKRQGVKIGMTAERVLQSSWGRPESVNRTITTRGTREQWVYPGMRNYLYFEDGILTSIQN